MDKISRLVYNSFRTVSNMSSIQKKFAIPCRYADSVYNVWAEFGQLGRDIKPVNLGQGFPDYNPPEYIPKTLSEVILSNDPGIHQYTRGVGHPRLVNVISKLYSKLLSRELNPLTNVLITCGAYEALFCVISGHINEGDEAIIIEPFFDCYEPMVKGVGGIPRFIALKNVTTNASGDVYTNSWKLDEQELRSLFNEKTKMIILNTPHNPLGKVFSLSELELIAELCIKYNVLCVSDEVYEWIVYEPLKHIRIASLPGMWERTVTIGSAGKTFSVTGWKCGWAYGPDYLIKNAAVVHQNNINSYSTPIQETIARCFEFELSRFDSPECYFKSISRELKPKREKFADLMKKIGFEPIIPEGGYFMIVNWSKLGKNLDLSSEKDEYIDFKFAKWMSKNVKVQGIPYSVFYCKKNKHLGVDYVRYCFYKKEETLKAAADNLLKWKVDCRL